MIVTDGNIHRIDLDVAERMADVFREEADALPENSELKRPMEKAVKTWERIADTLESRCS